MLGRARRTFTGLPALMQAGLFVVAIGALVDLGVHVGTGTSGLGQGHVAQVGHFTTLAGMVITMSGLITAARSRRPQKANTPKGQPR